MAEPNLQSVIDDDRDPTPEEIRRVMRYLGKRQRLSTPHAGRFNALSPERRREIAMMGVEARRKRRAAAPAEREGE